MLGKGGQGCLVAWTGGVVESGEGDTLRWEGARILCLRPGYL